MIKVYVKKQSNYPVSAPKIKKNLEQFLEKQGIVSDAEVSVFIVGEKKMLEFSKKYLKEKGIVHNVLSFPFSENSEGFISPPDDILRLGDIAVCYAKLVDEAKEEGVLIEDKLQELVEHGALHLLGIHHE